MEKVRKKERTEKNKKKKKKKKKKKQAAGHGEACSQSNETIIYFWNFVLFLHQLHVHHPSILISAGVRTTACGPDGESASMASRIRPALREPTM
jgi:hypothetical protein